MIYNPYLFYFGIPIPEINEKPPTIYSFLNSYVNYNAEEKTAVYDLAVTGRGCIFDFDYSLTDRLTKEEFESHLLNHYLMRRIGYETLTAFKIALKTKLDEILPVFNKLYNAIDDWDLFVSETTTKVGSNDSSQSNVGNSKNVSVNTTTSGVNSTGDSRYSKMPQNEIGNVQDGSYLTDYNLDTNTTNSSATDSGNTELNSSSNQENTGTYEETITRTGSIAEKLDVIKSVQNEISNIYKILYNELDDLFFRSSLERSKYE